MSDTHESPQEKTQAPATTDTKSDAAREKLLVDLAQLVAQELSLPLSGVEAVLRLIAEGGTVPFIARYRKEATGALDEVQIRAIQERHAYLLELEERRQTVLATIEEQGKLTDELRARILACTAKTELEDLYLPYKPKRRTRATIARERGLEPLAQQILAQAAQGNPLAAAQAFVDLEKEVPDVDAALAGARDIVAEIVAETAELRALVRRIVAESGSFTAEVMPKAKEQRTKFEQYYDFNEPIATIPSHRFLALRRGEREKVLRVKVEADATRIVPLLEDRMNVSGASPWAAQLRLAVEDSYQRLLSPAIENDMRLELKTRSDVEAVEVFAENLRNLLLAPPLGPRAVVGVDPGLRTGCKCAAVDATGRYLDTTTVYLARGEERVAQAERELDAFFDKYAPAAIAVGNGTGGRETEAVVRKILAARKSAGKSADAVAVQVSEAGASIYSASDIAREEFPELDLTIRGAISIARRLQDPLAELVKLDPKSIGVGQYQHDVHQPLLARKLDEVVESCVNRVGVELNTASAPLLAQVAGIGPKVAKKVVAHREAKGAFHSRKDLLKVAGLGPRTYEQAAGFLRLQSSENPLDASAVHPERYALVEQMARDLGVGVKELVGNEQLASTIEIARYVGGDVGEPTLRDIIAELKKPGRDPRASFEPPRFRDDVQEMSDLQPGMRLEGVITNVTNFGAFVDIGVHQDGLVHISELADHYVDDPHKVAKVGEKVSVRVLEVDLERKRISLSARSGEGPKRREGSSSGPAERQDRTAGRGDQRGPRGDSGGPRRDAGGRGGPPRKGGRDGGRDSGGRDAGGGKGFSNNPFARLLNKDGK